MNPSLESKSPIGIGVLGLGLMGRTHLRAYQAAIAAGYPGRVVALADRSTGLFDSKGRPKRTLPGEECKPLLDPERCEQLTDPLQLFQREDVQLVSICTHTDTHVDLAIAALEAGNHVLLEKPVALRASEVERLLHAERAAPGFCLPAMCMRFWPGWSWLKPAIDSGEYGRVLSASFRRLCAKPDWAPDFYGQLAKSGGALFDLHVHDADLVRWLFGAPQHVHSSGDLNHMTSTYRFQDGPAHVSAEGGWNHAPGFPFQMHFSIIFERASAVYSSISDPALVLYQDGEAVGLSMGQDYASGYDGEVRHALDVCRGAAPKTTLEETLALTRMLEAEQRSLLGA